MSVEFIRNEKEITVSELGGARWGDPLLCVYGNRLFLGSFYSRTTPTSTEVPLEHALCLEVLPCEKKIIISYFNFVLLPVQATILLDNFSLDWDALRKEYVFESDNPDVKYMDYVARIRRLSRGGIIPFLPTF